MYAISVEKPLQNCRYLLESQDEMYGEVTSQIKNIFHTQIQIL